MSEQHLISANRDTSHVGNMLSLIGTYADKRNAIVNLIELDYIDDANDRTKYLAICDTYAKVLTDLVRIYNADSDNVQIDVNNLLAYVKLGG